MLYNKTRLKPIVSLSKFTAKENKKNGRDSISGASVNEKRTLMTNGEYFLRVNTDLTDNEEIVKIKDETFNGQILDHLEKTTQEIYQEAVNTLGTTLQQIDITDYKDFLPEDEMIENVSFYNATFDKNLWKRFMSCFDKNEVKIFLLEHLVEWGEDWSNRQYILYAKDSLCCGMLYPLKNKR